MIGFVDENGRSMLLIQLRENPASPEAAIEVWIDTGFTGELVLPQTMINKLGLTQSGSVDAILADGRPIELDTYSCVLDWFGEARRLEAIANAGDFPLLGVGLLLGLDLRINYHTGKLTLNPT